MIYFTDNDDDKTSDDEYKVIFYEGPELLDKELLKGTYDSINGQS